MKNFFKKLNKGQEQEQDNLNLDYGDFYTGKSDRTDERRDDRFDERRAEPAADRSAGGYYDTPKANRGGYEEPDFRSDSTRYFEGDRPMDRPMERPMERPVERSVERPMDRTAEHPADSDNMVKPRETWQEADVAGYRPVQSEPAPEPTPVFTPAPAPEYLYFTPSTYRDCREGIVKGLATGHVVVVRLRKLEATDVLRLFDYMMGAVLALEGEMARPAATTVVLVPKDVEPEEEYEDAEEDEDTEDGEYDEEYDDEYDEDAEYEDEYEEEAEYDEEYDEEAEYEDEYEDDTYDNGEYGTYDEELIDDEELEDELMDDGLIDDEEYEDGYEEIEEDEDAR